MDEVSVSRLAAIAGKVLLGAFAAGFLGACLAFVSREHINEPLGTIGVALVLSAFAVSVVATALGFLLSIAAIRSRLIGVQQRKIGS